MNGESPYEQREFFNCMKPLVTDFDISCLLRAAEIPQKTALYWHRASVCVAGEQPETFLSFQSEGAHCAAHTSEELARLLDSSFAVIKADKIYVMLDLLACGFKHVDEKDPSKGGGLVLNMIRGCEDRTQVHCLARGVLVLAGQKVLRHQREVKQNGA